MNEIACPNCGRLNRRQAKFCAACGLALLTAGDGAIDDAPTMLSGFAPSGVNPAEEQQTAPAPRSFDLAIGRMSDTGRQRATNEDSLIALDFMWVNKSVSRAAGLFVIADGMGGHEGGEIASGMLVRTLARQAIEGWLPKIATRRDESFDSGAWLAAAIEHGNQEIYEWGHEAGFEMGTTVVAALIEGDQAWIAHVGDSRAYLVNDATIEQLTVDHSLVESLVAANQISREEARNHPQANVIYRTVGDHPQVTVDLKKVKLSRGDCLLLCSDGLNGMLTDEAIQQAVIGADSPQAACATLVDASNRAGGEDNCSVILIELKSA